MATTPDTDADFWEPLDLLHRTRTADARSAWALFDAALTKSGFPQSFYTFGVPMASKQPLRDKIARGIFGRGLFVDELFPELVKRPDLLATEPVAPHCKRSLTPFVWSSADLQGMDKNCISLAYDFGVSSFMVFPLRNGDATHYGNFTVFCGDARHKSWLRHAQRFAPLLHVTAQYFHDSLAGSDGEPPEPTLPALSPRQRECLVWASRGLSTKQIAERLTLSDPVVNEYLRAAKRKLGCATRAHAVARAIRLDLIRP
jgi:LuxR family transcriptional activator of bioluminescence operon/LuxR family transcriptional activator of conjugal transfer of Ti plasmids